MSMCRTQTLFVLYLCIFSPDRSSGLRDDSDFEEKGEQTDSVADSANLANVEEKTVSIAQHGTLDKADTGASQHGNASKWFGCTVDPRTKAHNHPQTVKGETCEYSGCTNHNSDCLCAASGWTCYCKQFYYYDPCDHACKRCCTHNGQLSWGTANYGSSAGAWGCQGQHEAYDQYIAGKIGQSQCSSASLMNTNTEISQVTTTKEVCSSWCTGRNSFCNQAAGRCQCKAGYFYDAATDACKMCCKCEATGAFSWGAGAQHGCTGNYAQDFDPQKKDEYGNAVYVNKCS